MRLACILALAALTLPGCIATRSGPATEPAAADAAVAPASVDVFFEFSGRTLIDGVKDDAETFGEVTIFAAHVARELDELGVIRKIVDRPSPETLRLRVHIEDARGGPAGLRVASKATLRILPAWETTSYIVRAKGAYRGRSLEPFRSTGGVTEVYHLALIPLAPFMPLSRRGDLSRDTAVALARHVARAVHGIQEAGGA